MDAALRHQLREMVRQIRIEAHTQDSSCAVFGGKSEGVRHSWAIYPVLNFAHD